MINYSFQSVEIVSRKVTCLLPCYQIKWKHRILVSQKKKKRKKERKNRKWNQNSNVSLFKYSNLGTLMIGNLVITRYIIIMILFYIVGRFYLKKRMTRDDSEFLTNIFSFVCFFYLQKQPPEVFRNKGFLEILQNSQKKTPVPVSLFTCNFKKRGSGTGVFL